MEEEKKAQYFYVTMCKIGLLFIALGIVRVLAIHQDGLGFTLGLIGFSLVIAHTKFVEKKWGITTKYLAFSTAVFTIAFVLLAYWLAFPN